MEDLIRIRKSIKTGEPVVSARDLHRVLGVKEDFSNWLKRRIKKYRFKENVDFALIFFDVHGNQIPLAKNSETDVEAVSKVHRIEYALTMDCAKEIAMVQANDKGKMVRDYFIQVEKDYRELTNGEILQRYGVEIYEMSDVAKMLDLSDYFGKIGRTRLYEILRHRKIVDEKNMALPKYVKRGFFENKPTHGIKVTEKGVTFLNQMLTIENTEVKKLRRELKIAENEIHDVQSGVSLLMEMLLVNKMGRKMGEDRNREVMECMQKYIDKTKPKRKALGK